MRKFLNIENPVLRRLSTLLDFFLLNLVVLVTSLPLITIIGNCMSLFQVISRYDTTQDQSIVKAYLKYTKKNFWRGIQLLMVLMPIGSIILLSLNFSLSLAGFIGTYSKITTLIGLSLWNSIMTSTIFYFSRYDGKFFRSIKNAALISLNSLSILIIGFLFTVIEIFILDPSFLLTLCYVLTFGGFCGVGYLNFNLLLPIFKKYEIEDSKEK